MLGIPKAGSLILARIAGQLEEESDLRHTHKRLDYHLHSDRWDEHAVQEQALQVALEEVPWKPETVIRGDSLEMGSGFYEAPKPG